MRSKGAPTATPSLSASASSASMVPVETRREEGCRPAVRTASEKLYVSWKMFSGLGGHTYVPDPRRLSSVPHEMSRVIPARNAVRETPISSHSTRSAGRRSPPGKLVVLDIPKNSLNRHDLWGELHKIRLPLHRLLIQKRMPPKLGQPSHGIKFGLDLLGDIPIRLI